MQISHENWYPYFVELLISASPLDDKTNTIALRPELRVAQEEVETEEGVLIVSVSRLILELESIGYTIYSGSRLGEPVKSVSTTIKTSHNEESTKALQAKAASSISIAPHALDFKADTSASAEMSGKITRTRAQEVEELVQRVVARGGNRWEVREPDGKLLDGTYLIDQDLCRLIAEDRANQRQITVRILVAKRDISLEILRNQKVTDIVGKIFKNKNKEKLLKAWLAKQIIRSPDPSDHFSIILSKAEAEDVE